MKVFFGYFLVFLLPGCDPSPLLQSNWDPWTLIVLPDTQGYTSTQPDIWLSQTKWIAEHQDELNIQLVAHVGDVTEWNSSLEWSAAAAGLGLLPAQLPLVVVPGNHDYAADVERSTGQNEVWPIDRLLSSSLYAGTFEPARTDNSFQILDIGEEHWLVLGLEWGPRDEVLNWANVVLDHYPDRRVAIVTHAYLFSDNRRYDWRTYGNAQAYNPHSYIGVRWPEVNDGEEIWEKLVRHRNNVDLVLCGHVPEVGVGRLTSPTAGGHVVHQLLANFQSRERGGNGFLRIMTFFPERIEVKTYSALLDTYETTDEHQFELSR